ncbi:lysylphosphatidylglycerol synthase transmembrane domain-containing protein [Kineococcus sp. SYSU DK006]|uniref:lysylphosphatidylglycerol synthase transmembrane domain-containing protein n=1 Tax=Kineococcus sp. SYSU DK006 TaxID=3383127 RepID=UPI003D7DEA31
MTPDHPPTLPRRRSPSRRVWTLLLAVATIAAVLVLARRLEGADLGERLRGAQVRWLVLAVLLSVVPLLGNVASMVSLAPVRLPVVRTGVVWLATSFVNLVTPSSTGGVALTVRYVQRQGAVPLAVAATTIGVVQSTSFAVTAVVLGICLLAVGREWGVADLVPWPVPALAVAGVVLVVVTGRSWPWARRQLRERVVAPVRREWPGLRGALTSPRRLAVALTGHLAVPLGFAATLDASARAFGGEPSFALLVLVVVGSSAVTAAVPVPGGVGASEAALTAGLVAAGLEPGPALSAALLHRLLTFWVRVPPAWAALVWLRRRGAV